MALWQCVSANLIPLWAGWNPGSCLSLPCPCSVLLCAAYLHIFCSGSGTCFQAQCYTGNPASKVSGFGAIQFLSHAPSLSFQLILHGLSWMQMKNSNPCQGPSSWDGSSSQNIIAESWQTSFSFSLHWHSFLLQSSIFWKNGSFRFCEIWELPASALWTPLSESGRTPELWPQPASGAQQVRWRHSPASFCRWLVWRAEQRTRREPVIGTLQGRQEPSHTVSAVTWDTRAASRIWCPSHVPLPPRSLNARSGGGKRRGGGGWKHPFLE